MLMPIKTPRATLRLETLEKRTVPSAAFGTSGDDSLPYDGGLAAYTRGDLLYGGEEYSYLGAGPPINLDFDGVGYDTQSGRAGDDLLDSHVSNHWYNSFFDQELDSGLTDDLADSERDALARGAGPDLLIDLNDPVRDTTPALAADPNKHDWRLELSELSEMETLRSQMNMDRLAKSMSTLSNDLANISDTADGITRNMK